MNNKIPNYVVTELDTLLRIEGENGLANSLAKVNIVARCKCEDPECSSFWTKDIPELPTDSDRWRQIVLLGDEICYCLDVVDNELVYVEVVHPDQKLNHHLLENCRKEK